ncbi:MAG: sulfotransferase [Proteobacteria bacterium]|nr:sulfotransferase [Pseudomonadota bacterium]
MINKLSIVFIVGCQRTGTTLLGNMLGAHPKAYLLDEPNGLYPWVDAVFNGMSSFETNLLFKQCCRSARKNYKQPNSKCSQEGVLTEQVTHLILKAPNLTYQAEKIAEYFPGQYCIFTYRDIRDVVVSMAKLDWIPMVDRQLEKIRTESTLRYRFAEEIALLESQDLAAHQARAYIARIKTLLRDTFNRPEINKIEASYEGLVCDPAFWYQRFLSHIHLSDEAGVSDHSRVMAGWGPGLTYRRGKVNTNSIGQWKHYLSTSQENDVWKIAGPLMQELNYLRNQKFVQHKNLWGGINSNLKHQPIVATGRGGSGTRLLSILLQALNVFLGANTGGTEDSLDWVNLLYRIAIERNRGKGQKPITMGHWQHALRETAADSLTTGGWNGHQQWGWKLPETMMCLPEISEAFPQFKLVHLVRHPVDISLRRTHMTSRPDNPMGKSVLEAAYNKLGWSGEDIGSDPEYIRNAASWYYQVGMVADFGREELGPGRYLEIRYEDICMAPNKALVALAKFLGIQDYPQLVDVQIDTTRQRAWSPPDSRVDKVWSVCREIAETLGYQEVDNLASIETSLTKIE